MKELCDCGKVALWCYMPNTSIKGNPFFCDDCVPRNCTCNQEHVDEDYEDTGLPNQNVPKELDEPFIWIEEGKIWESVDENGRKYPCCEFFYDENGWDIE